MAPRGDRHEGTVLLFVTRPFGFTLFPADDGVGHGLGQATVTGSTCPPLPRGSPFNPEWERWCACTPDIRDLLFPLQQGLVLVFKKGFSVFLYILPFIFKHTDMFL